MIICYTYFRLRGVIMDKRESRENRDDLIGVSNLKYGTDLPFEREVNVRKSVKSGILFIFFLVLTGVIASVGFAFFAQALTYNNKIAAKSEKWDIAFTDMKLTSKKGRAVEVSAPQFEDTRASFNVALNEPGDEIEYTITISNRGSFNAMLNSIILTPENNENDDILYYVKDINTYDYLDVRSSKKMKVLVKYNENSSGKRLVSKNAEIILNYVQR